MAADWEGWGHRKLAAVGRAGIDSTEPGPVSDSTMYRVLARNGLALPADCTAQVRQAAGARKEAFTDPPTRRYRQTPTTQPKEEETVPSKSAGDWVE